MDIKKIERHLADIYTLYSKRSPAGKAVLSGRFSDNVIPMSQIAMDIDLTKQSVDQLEKRIISAANDGYGQEIKNFLSGQDDIFDISPSFTIKKAQNMFGKILTGVYGCHQVSGSIYSKVKFDIKEVINSIADATRESGLPMPIDKIKFSSLGQNKGATGLSRLFVVEEVLNKFSIVNGVVYYHKSSVRSSSVSNLALYIQSGFGKEHGLSGVYKLYKKYAADMLKLEGIKSYEEFMDLVSKRSCNLPARSVFAINKGEWEISSYFINTIGGGPVVDKIVAKSLEIANRLPCDTTAVYLHEKLLEDKILNEKINHYSLKSILVYSGKFKNIKKFNIIPTEKECEKTAFGLKESVLAVLKDGPKTSKEIIEELKTLGLTYTGVTIGMILTDKKKFRCWGGKYSAKP